MSAGVRLKGFEGVHAVLKGLGDPAVAKKITDSATAAGARVIRDEARFHMPSARLAKEVVVRKKRKRTGSHSQIGYTKKAWWAHFVELGTAAHTIIVGARKQGGRFGRSGKAKKVLADSQAGEIFGPVVHHPGAPAQELLTKAAESEQDHALEVMARRIWRGINRYVQQKRGGAR